MNDNLMIGLIFLGIMVVCSIIDYIMTSWVEINGKIYFTRCVKCDIPTDHKFYDDYICEECLRESFKNDK